MWFVVAMLWTFHRLIVMIWSLYWRFCPVNTTHIVILRRAKPTGFVFSSSYSKQLSHLDNIIKWLCYGMSLNGFFILHYITLNSIQFIYAWLCEWLSMYGSRGMWWWWWLTQRAEVPVRTGGKERGRGRAAPPEVFFSSSHIVTFLSPWLTVHSAY